MKNSPWIQKIVASGLMLALVLPLFVVPQKVSAQVGTVELPGPSLAHQFITATQAFISGGHDAQDTLVTFVLKPLALALGRAAVQSITTSTVNWINGGFQGSPAFATDLRTNLRQLSDGVAQNFLLELANSAKINSPFVDSLVTNVGAAYFLYADRDALANQLQDTLGQSSRDAAAFRAGNFNEGGWGAFISQVTNDANNPIGARMLASQALAGRLSAAANQRVQELSWGSGFLSWKGDCIKTNNTSAGAHSGGSTTTGGATGTSGHTGTVGAGGTGATNTGGGSTTGGTATNNSAHSLSDAEGCIDREIVTPGSFIAHKGNKTTDAVVDQLLLAQSIDAIVGALAQQLISKALGGSGGLRGASNPNPGGGASATTNTGTNNGTDGGTGLIAAKDGFETVVQTSITQVTAWKTDSQTILTVAESARTACVNNPTQLADPINPAINSSTAAISKAAELLASLSDLLEQLQNASTSNDDLTSSTYLQVVSAYQALDIPSTVVMSGVAADAKDSGTSPSPSLYKSLSTLATNNCVPFDPEKP
jgi:hypothetical protein